MTSLAIVTEGGRSVGLGHLRRCVTLAEALTRGGVHTTFRVAGGEAAEALVRDAGFPMEAHADLSDAAELSGWIAGSPAEGVLIDSYRADEEVFLACAAKKTIVIDDLADRPLPVDMVINSTIAAERLDYGRLTPARLLLGPRYALLRPEFTAVSERRPRPSIERVMITLGGSDHGSLASSIVRWCAAAAPTAALDVVIGPFFERLDLLRELESDRIVLLEQPHMRDVMLLADLAVTSGGQTLFELAATGTPAIVLTTAANQVEHARAFADRGTVVLAGSADDPDLPARFAIAYESVRDVAARAEMSRRGRELVDGRGAERTASAIVELLQGDRSGTV